MVQLLQQCTACLLFPYSPINSHMAGKTIVFSVFKVHPAIQRGACVPFVFPLEHLLLYSWLWQLSSVFIAIIGKNGVFL